MLREPVFSKVFIVEGHPEHQPAAQSEVASAEVEQVANDVLEPISHLGGDVLCSEVTWNSVFLVTSNLLSCFPNPVRRICDDGIESCSAAPKR